MSDRKVPKLRFLEFSGNWVTKNIGSILSIGSGRDYKYLNSGIYPVFGTGGLMTHVDQYLHDGESVCIGRKGTIDKPVFMNGKFWTVDTLFYTHSFINTIPKFVYNIFQKINWSLYNEATGVPSLSKATIESIKVKFPYSLEEQTKIADFLTSIDDKIQQLTKKKELLEHYKKGVMRDIFSQKIRFKDDNGNDYPDWEVNKFGAITVNVSKKNLNSTLYPIYSVNNKTGFIPQSEQFDGLDSNERNYDISLYKIVNKFTFAYNPARINVGSLGYSGELENIIISSLYVCFKTIDIIDDTFLLQYFKSNFFKKSVLQNIEGGVREYLFYDNFAKIKINTPSKSEQVKISSFLTNIDDKITQVNTQLEHAKLFKKSLLQQMFI